MDTIFQYDWALKNAIFTKTNGTVFSCFAGGGGSTMGYKLAGFDVIGCNEIDPKMMAAYIKNHNPKFSFLEGIQTFKLREDLPKELYELDILDGSPPCFIAGTLIHTDRGFIAIEDVKIGDKVLTHKNRFMSVIDVMQKEYNGDLHHITSMGSSGVYCTPEHPLYTKKRLSVNSVFDNPDWIDAADVSKGDSIALPISAEENDYKWDGVIFKDGLNKTTRKFTKIETVNTLPIENEDFWWIVGRWLGDGWVRLVESNAETTEHHIKTRHTVFIWCNKNNSETDDITTVLKRLNIRYNISRERTANKISFSSREFALFLTQFGNSCYNKKIPYGVLHMKKTLQLALLNGYLSADGHKEETTIGVKWSYSSVSKELVFGINYIAMRVYEKVNGKLDHRLAVKNHTIEGRKVNSSDSFSGEIKTYESDRQFSIFDDGKIWTTVRNNVTSNFYGTVYNLSVEVDESYTANNICVHNCSSFSSAGNRDVDWGKSKKFREGQQRQVLDTLFFDFIDLAKRLQPKVVVAENVRGLLMGNAIDYVHRIYDELDEAGYVVQHWTLDASKMGVPQKRERVFFVALRKDLCKDELMYYVNTCDLKPRLDLHFDDAYIPFSAIADNTDTTHNMPKSVFELWGQMGNMFGGLSKVHPKGSFFSEIRADPNRPAQTLTSKGTMYHPFIPRRINASEACKIGTFPSDYDFGDNKYYYVVGMSVPPIMVARLADRINKQWLIKIKGDPMSDGGKGSKPRPIEVDPDTYANNWDAIFKKKPKQSEENSDTIEVSGDADANQNRKV